MNCQPVLADTRMVEMVRLKKLLVEAELKQSDNGKVLDADEEVSRLMRAI